MAFYKLSLRIVHLLRIVIFSKSNYKNHSRVEFYKMTKAKGQGGF